jgi:hypothetical protein
MEQVSVDVAGGVACAIKLGRHDTENMRLWVERGDPHEPDTRIPAAWGCETTSKRTGRA